MRRGRYRQIRGAFDRFDSSETMDGWSRVRWMAHEFFKFSGGFLADERMIYRDARQRRVGEVADDFVVIDTDDRKLTDVISACAVTGSVHDSHVISACTVP